MKLRDFALRILLSESIDEKLAAPPTRLADSDPEPARLPMAPARPRELQIARIQDAKVPAREGMADPAQRARILHAFANHELQAVELGAWALLAYPSAPSAFRRGLLCILRDEQEHTRMYLARLAAMGRRFGEWPVSGYFWNKARHFTTPLQFVCAMSLTFENANLDHTRAYARSARAAGDAATAALLERVHTDEVGHVRFGWRWLRRLKEPAESMWDAYTRALAPPLEPRRARGEEFHAGGRAAAGLDAEFIERLRSLGPSHAFGGKRRAGGKRT